MSDNEVLYKEDYAACSCGIQNFQLAAWEEGVGVQWSTGPILFDERTYELLGLNSSEIGIDWRFVYSYPECTGNPSRKSVKEVTYYLD